MILLLVIIKYIKDCKEIGKDDLAVPLSERLFTYFVFIFLPLLLCVLYRVL